MHCIATPPSPTIANHQSTGVSKPTSLTPPSLLAIFSTVTDPRRKQGTRFPLAAILTLAVAATLSNHLSVLAIAEWGASQSKKLLHLLGFPKGVAPHQSTIQRLFSRLNPLSLARTLAGYAVALTSHCGAPGRGMQGVSVDGKAQRGRLAADPAAGPVHALSAFCHDLGVVLAEVPISSTAEKTEAELIVAPALIAQLPWQGRVLTGDALLCQRSLCQQLLEARGDYLLVVKENQPTLHEDIRLLFDPPLPALPLQDRRVAQTVDHGHGRKTDIRCLVASTDLVGYTQWPGLAQVFRVERTWQKGGKSHREVQYGITSLPPQLADAGRLLALKRGHWQIENRLHYVKDTVLGEDRSLVHMGAGPSVLSMLRDTVVSLLHRVGSRSVARQLRFYSRHPRATLALLVPQPYTKAGGTGTKRRRHTRELHTWNSHIGRTGPGTHHFNKFPCHNIPLIPVPP